jgi:hypothetical protein
MNKEVITKLFPIQDVGIVSRNKSADLEVNGLPRGFTPQNCEILDMGEEVHGNMRRTHYLVKVGEYVAFLTVCLPEYGDSLYALIRGLARSGTDEECDVMERAKLSLAMVCSPATRLRAA